MAKKKSVLFYLDNYTPSMKGLSFEQKGMLFDAIISYGGGIADMPDGMGLLSLAFDPIKATMDRDMDKYEQVCERNRKNGLKGGKPKQTQTNPLGSSGLGTEPTLTHSNPNKPDKDKEKDTIQIKEPEKTLCDPSHEEPFYLTAKKKKLQGKRLEAFEEFWEAFDYKKSKSSAADSWLALTRLDNKIMEAILSGARDEAAGRKARIESGSTPKMAQGWITERRWEDEHHNPGGPSYLDQCNAEQAKKRLSPQELIR